MTNKLILTLFAGLVIGSFHLVRAQSYDKTLATREPGTAPQLSAEDAKRFDEIVDTGFQVRYEVGGKTSTAYTWGNKLSSLRTEKVKLDNGVVRVSAVTDDKALEIITHFIFDEKKQRVIIDRKIRNISAETVNVQMMSAYVDPKLVLGDQSQDAKSDSEQEALKRIRAGHLIYKALKHRPDPSKAGYFDDCECEPPPVLCVTIRCRPEEKYISARWYLLPGDNAMLQWDPFMIQASQKAGAEGALPVNEQHFVMVFGLR